MILALLVAVVAVVEEIDIGDNLVGSAVDALEVLDDHGVGTHTVISRVAGSGA